jgi:hypothetical protein
MEPQTSKPTPITPIGESAVTETARRSFKARDLDYAQEIDSLADDVEAGKIKYDSKLKERLEAAKTHASTAGNNLFAETIALEFGANAVSNPAKLAKSLRDLAKALK